MSEFYGPDAEFLARPRQGWRWVAPAWVHDPSGYGIVPVAEDGGWVIIRVHPWAGETHGVTYRTAYGAVTAVEARGARQQEAERRHDRTSPE